MLKKKLYQDWKEGQRHGMGWSHTHECQTKVGSNISGAMHPSPILHPLAQCSSARKRICHNFWLLKAAEIEAVEDSPWRILLLTQLREPKEQSLN